MYYCNNSQGFSLGRIQMYVINDNSDVERSPANLNNKLANCHKFLDYI